jgi:hypothetical protein
MDDSVLVVIVIGIIFLTVHRLRNYLLLGAVAAPDRFGTLMPPIVSLAVLGAALFVILSHGYDDSHQKWAYAAVGIILGYWLRSPNNIINQRP